MCWVFGISCWTRFGSVGSSAAPRAGCALGEVVASLLFPDTSGSSYPNVHRAFPGCELNLSVLLIDVTTLIWGRLRPLGMR